MDRNKPPGGSRSTKGKINLSHHGSELYALGMKSSSSQSVESKNKVITSSKNVVSDRKREAVPSLSRDLASKKPKLSLTIGSSSRTIDNLSSSASVPDFWEQIAIESEPAELVTSILAAIEQQDSDTVVSLVCGGIKSIISPRSKPDSMTTLSLLYLAKLRPNLFCNEIITSALVSILKRDSQHTFKGRNNPTIHVLAANLLARGYHDKKQWPEIFLRIYIDDAVNERVWIDYEDCNSFVENICTAFGTKIPHKSMLQPELNALVQTSRDNFGLDEESGDASLTGESIKSGDSNSECTTQPRYTHLTATVEKLVMDAVKEQLNRRQPPDCSTRNFLRFLSTTSGLSEVRAVAVTRLELWIHNGKLMKPAQELLTFICFNITGQSTKDHEVLANLVKMRLKTKPLINIYMSCLKEIITSQPDILFILLKYVVQNELSNARNPNNMGILANMFQAKPDASAQHLASIYQEFLMQREDCLRTLRVFLRELVKMLRYDINLLAFCKALLTNRTELALQIQNFEFKDRIFHSMVDLVCLCMFLSVSPQIREATASMRSGRDYKGSSFLHNFHTQMSQMQCDSLTWMHDVVPTLFKPNTAEYSQTMHKLLLIDAPDQYSKGDQWPPEPERALLMRLVSEIPLHQDTILRIILIGVTKEIPFNVPDTMEVIDQIVKRAATLKNSDVPPLETNKLEIIDFLFSMAEYHHPDNIVLPVGYNPPKLAISALYWKAWNILLILSAHNPGTIGLFCWENYSMLRTLMEMCITNQFSNMKPIEEELQVAALEKTKILEFEAHLAAATSKVIITEQNSLLLSQLMLMDPLGIARRPPNTVLEHLQSLNASLKLGHLLCRSRKPDLLLDIIQRQGSSQSMPWLADLVQNSDGDFNHLPVQCLCEFLLSNSHSISTTNSRDLELLSYLQNLLKDENSDYQISCEVLEYFLRRLSSTSKNSRQLAIKGLKLLLQCFTPKENEMEISDFAESDWLLQHLPLTPHFPYIRPILIMQLRAACQIENSPDLIMTYIQFIATNTLHDPISDMLEHVMDMSQLIVERSTVFAYIVPTWQDTNENKIQTLNCLFLMFHKYLSRLMEEKTSLQLPEYPELLRVEFLDGSQLLIHLNIIQAFVILLTHSPTIQGAAEMLDMWFPKNAPPPLAYQIDTSEPVQILPDWLKLKMIRSSVDRLVDVAIRDLTPDQIVLFVQNFGTPLTSMSKLLGKLDLAVVEQYSAVENAVLNIAYLRQLIKIQQSRGCKNGHVTLHTVEDVEEPSTDIEKPSVSVLETLNIDFQSAKSSNDKQTAFKAKEIEEIVDSVLKSTTLTKTQTIRFRKLIQALIGKDLPINIAQSKRSQQFTSAAQVQEYVAIKILNYLHKIAKGPQGPFYFQNIPEKSSPCSLFRCLLSWVPVKSENYNFLVQVVDECLNYIKPQSVLYQILNNKRLTFIKVEDDINTVEKKDLVQILYTAKISEVEKSGKILLNKLMKGTNGSYLVDAISSVLQSSGVVIKSEKGESPVQCLTEDKMGLLVDWLAEADTELVTSNQDLQMNLLFNSSTHYFRFFMLSLLSHQTSWSTLKKTVNKLLAKYNEHFDPSSVLDFISALINNPKLWQGRDKSVTKHEQRECVLLLNTNEIHTFVDYILNEDNIREAGLLNSKENQIMQRDDTNNRINARISLLLQCINPDTLNLPDLINYVTLHNGHEDIKKKFLQHLYLKNPPMKFVANDLQEIYDSDLKDLIGCTADKISHYTLTSLSILQNPRDYQMLSQDLEMFVRKLAATHPFMVLRQLSMVSSLLQGRAYMEIGVLRCEYHLSLFNQVLGILEILQPHVFHDVYREGFHSALECYFALLRNHGHAKDIYTIMYRFMDLLQAYTNENTTRALIFIEQYAELLQHLALCNRNIISLQQIVQGVALLKHKTTNSIIDTEQMEEQTTEIENSDNDVKPSASSSSIVTDVDSRGAAAVILAPYSKMVYIPHNWHNLIKAVNCDQPENLIQVLQDIEHYSTKRPALLADIFEKLLELILSPAANIRQVAYILLIRYLKHNPGDITTNANTLSAYIQCLSSEDATIASSAIESLTEFTICLQEYAPIILNKVFNLGITTKTNIYGHIRKCVLALKTQHAC